VNKQLDTYEERKQEITNYAKLITTVVMRLEQIWQEGEGQLTITVRDDNNQKCAKIEGGHTNRI
jgi:hypothetical protein